MCPAIANPIKAMRRLHRRYVRNCKNNNVYWELSVEFFHKITSQPCEYCQKLPAQKDRAYIYNGIDRVNPHKGYEVGNVVPCCKECNSLKSNKLTYEETKVVAQALKEFREKKNKPNLP